MKTSSDLAMRCKRCDVPLEPAKAIVQTYKRGVEDFGGPTLQAGGPGKLVDVLKCPKCGYSVVV